MARRKKKNIFVAECRFSESDKKKKTGVEKHTKVGDCKFYDNTNLVKLNDKLVQAMEKGLINRDEANELLEKASDVALSGVYWGKMEVEESNGHRTVNVHTGNVVRDDLRKKKRKHQALQRAFGNALRNPEATGEFRSSFEL